MFSILPSILAHSNLSRLSQEDMADAGMVAPGADTEHNIRQLAKALSPILLQLLGSVKNYQ